MTLAAGQAAGKLLEAVGAVAKVAVVRRLFNLSFQGGPLGVSVGGAACRSHSQGSSPEIQPKKIRPKYVECRRTLSAVSQRN